MGFSVRVKTLWTSHMTPDALYDEHWLLAYEANIKGWLPNAGGVDHVGGDPNFAFLRANGVHFYDTNLAAPPVAVPAATVPVAPVPLPTVPTIPLFEISY